MLSRLLILEPGETTWKHVPDGIPYAVAVTPVFRAGPKDWSVTLDVHDAATATLVCGASWGGAFWAAYDPLTTIWPVSPGVDRFERRLTAGQCLTNRVFSLVGADSARMLMFFA